MTTDATTQVEAIVDPATGHVITADRQWAWVNDTWVPAASVGVSPQAPAPQPPSTDAAYTAAEPSAHTFDASAEAAGPVVFDEPTTFVLDPKKAYSSTSNAASKSRLKRGGGGGRRSGGSSSRDSGVVDPNFLATVVPLALLAILGGMGVSALLTGIYLMANLESIFGGAFGGLSTGDGTLMSDPMAAQNKAETVIRNAQIMGGVLSLIFISVAAWLTFKLGNVNSPLLGGVAVALVSVTFGWLIVTFLGSNLIVALLITLLVGATVAAWCIKVGRTT